jgi:probable HAF family extracellular repeat protein
MASISRAAIALAAMAHLFACGGTAAKSARDTATNPESGSPGNGIRYDTLDLSRLDGPDSITDAEALDDQGAVAGRICDDPPLCASMRWDLFLWDGTMHRFHVDDGVRASVSATAAGRIAGTLEKADRALRAFISSGTDLLEMPTLGGDSFVTAMNASGLAVGTSVMPSGEKHAVAWKDGSITDLGARTAMAHSVAMAVDDSSAVAVLACHQAAWPSGCRAMILTDSGALDLGAIPDELSSSAMNVAGRVVGSRYVAEVPHAAAWAAGQTTDLDAEISALSWPSLGARAGNQLESYFVAVGASGEAVGGVAIPISEGAAATAILWKDGTLFELAAGVEPPMRLHSGVAINAKGQILARRAEQGYGQVLLTPR